MSDKPNEKVQPELDENEQIVFRKQKLASLRELGEAYPNDFQQQHYAQPIIDEFGELDNEQLEQKDTQLSLAGRVMTRRIMGKASFIHIQDVTGQLQAYVQKNAVGQDTYEQFKSTDLGDILGITGSLFKTKTGELTIKADNIRLLVKSLRPLPEKYHGLTNTEQRYRQRYLDLLTNEKSRQVFLVRSKTIEAIRGFLTTDDFLEVETPMMQVIPGGATARPFQTHHNALSMDMFLRISPELYLKRLLVGGLERVFEINRNFRNEGLSTRHNPEFTMLEYYQAYADYTHAMDKLEDMIRSTARAVLSNDQITYQGTPYNLNDPFRRLSVIEAIAEFNSDIAIESLEDFEQTKAIAERLHIPLKNNWGRGKLLIEIFEKTVESKLHQPTFITDYPAEVSPLARRSDKDAFFTDRFELFIGGREIANGFSELNDPEDQASRFRAQVEEKEAGDDEAMFYDEDYIIALEHGMPPAAGVGVGIDRLVMFFTDSPSIRDVILFPHLRQA